MWRQRSYITMNFLHPSCFNVLAAPHCPVALSTFLFPPVWPLPLLQTWATPISHKEVTEKRSEVSLGIKARPVLVLLLKIQHSHIYSIYTSWVSSRHSSAWWILSNWFAAPAFTTESIIPSGSLVTSSHPQQTTARAVQAAVCLIFNVYNWHCTGFRMFSASGFQSCPSTVWEHRNFWFFGDVCLGSTSWMNICCVKHCSLNLFCISVYFAATLSSWNPWVMFTAMLFTCLLFFSCLTWINHGVKHLETFHLQREKNLALACVISSLCFVFCQQMGRPAASCPHPNPSSPRSPPPPAQGASASTRYYVSYTLLHLILPQICVTLESWPDPLQE